MKSTKQSDTVWVHCSLLTLTECNLLLTWWKSRAGARSYLRRNSCFHAMMDAIDCKLPSLLFNGLQSKTSGGNFIIHLCKGARSFLYFSLIPHANIGDVHKWMVRSCCPFNWLQRRKPLRYFLCWCFINVRSLWWLHSSSGQFVD